MNYQEKYPDYVRMISDMSSIAGAEKIIKNDGDANGLRAVEVYTAAGLRFEILLDRGMDIGACSYKGIPIGFVSKIGIKNVANALAMPKGFSQYFAGGLLTTCGIDNVGVSCEDHDVLYPIHGSRTFLQAFDVCTSAQSEGHKHNIRVKGKMRQATLFKENIILTREIVIDSNTSEFTIIDNIENASTIPYEYMLLYHINFSFPLVSPDSTLKTNFSKTEPFNEAASKSSYKYNDFEYAQNTYEERVYSFSQPQGTTAAAELINPAIHLKASVEYSPDELPEFTEWINMMEQDYVVGLEPGTHKPISRKLAREKNLLCELGPKEQKTVMLKISIAELI